MGIIAIDILVCLVLFAVPFVVYFAKRNQSLKKTVQHALSGVESSQRVVSFRAMYRDRADFWINIVIGLFFVVVYLSFRYLGSDWQYLSPLHIIGFLSTVALPFALSYLCKGSRRSAFVLAIIMSSLLLISPFTRPIVWGYSTISGDREFSMSSWTMAVPLNLSNIFALLSLFIIISKNKMLSGFMVCIGLVGGVLNNVQIHNEELSGFWHYLRWESYFLHALIIIIPIFALLTGLIRLDYKKSLLNFVWFTPWFFATGMILNPLWGTNYNFTYPISALSFLPQILGPVSMFGGQVYPFYMIGVFIVFTIFCVLFHLLGSFLQNKVSKYYSDNRSSIKLSNKKLFG